MELKVKQNTIRYWLKKGQDYNRLSFLLSNCNSRRIKAARHPEIGQALLDWSTQKIKVHNTRIKNTRIKNQKKKKQKQVPVVELVQKPSISQVRACPDTIKLFLQ